MPFPIPRSILFVPASRPDFFDKAASGQADAVCLDLEDGVASSLKEQARQNLEAACSMMASSEKIIMVRVNSEAEFLEDDLVSLPSSCRAVMLPKVHDISHMNAVAERLDEMAKAGAADAVLIPLLEDAAGLLSLENTWKNPHPRVLALCPGMEDFSNDLGCAPDSRLIQSVMERMAVVASAMGVFLLGFPGSIANFTDLERLRRSAMAGVECGSLSGLCIHPAQVDILNEVFSPSAENLDRARHIVEAFESAGVDQKGAIAVDGQMVDLPVYKRAKALLSGMGR